LGSTVGVGVYYEYELANTAEEDNIYFYIIAELVIISIGAAVAKEQS